MGDEMRRMPGLDCIRFESILQSYRNTQPARALNHDKQLNVKTVRWTIFVHFAGYFITHGNVDMKSIPRIILANS